MPPEIKGISTMKSVLKRREKEQVNPFLCFPPKAFEEIWSGELHRGPSTGKS